MKTLLYANRAIAFMDILGMRSLVKRIGKDEALRLNLHDSLNHIKNQERYAGLNNSILSKLEVTVFSDCIVISSPPEDLRYLVWVCMNLQNELLMMGIALRGGITIGKLTHGQGLVYGEGLVRAYEIESTEARTPRILFDHDLGDALPSGYFDKHFLDRDDDSRVIINPLVFDAVIPGAQDLAAEGYDPRQIFLSEVRRQIVLNINSATDEKSKAKWYWLADRLENATVIKPCYPEIEPIPRTQSEA